MQETILITGGSGLVGAQLTQLLIKEGYLVKHISRAENIKSNTPCFKWDLNKSSWDKNAIKGVDYIVHLAGANVAEGRWTTKRKKAILESRVAGSQLVCEMVTASDGRIKGVISASAVGYYGVDGGVDLMVETRKSGSDFLATVCEQWEQAILACKTRVSIFRTGVVLSKSGGAIAKMLAPIKWGVGSPLGIGSQPMPWIHIDDVCNMYLYAINNKLKGIYNAVAPECITNQELTAQLAKSVNRKIVLPNIPAFVLQLMLGEMAQMLLTGVNVSVEKIKNVGFKFKFPTLKDALDQIFIAGNK